MGGPSPPNGSFDAVVDIGHGTTGDESGRPNSVWVYAPRGVGGIGGVQRPLPQSRAVFETLSTVTVPHCPLRGPPLTQYCPVSVG
jgi:hypothetical protein